ncbi:MAG: type II CRISPR RNA-guided endonuclease Cas9 [Bacteroides sp.]|uniref:type II CRISPR RNA-guided endonuclease Cas9 n=1 Tax=Bacteroides sp. TaxID=29523 RepID=UPI001B6EF3CC|nr:type II CRISPR RNA-guided endonuclease Cas9 [Bacteroides sp.]MBP6067913.1 type II CRISPR RNA-guided endonuclease Cas9 [Bacteroides sp.]
MSKILGLDLGTNSIGWALVEKNQEGAFTGIVNAGSRIIPMDAETMKNFNNGITQTQTAERTRLRGVRRLLERSLLRRERIHRLLNTMNILPVHYAEKIDFVHRLGKFLGEEEPKYAYKKDEFGKAQFLFMDSFTEMLEDFQKHQPELVLNNKKVPYDWTIYYLRKKALDRAITKEELGWIILQFNAKRGYYQLRGEDDESIKEGKKEEYFALKVIRVEADNSSVAKRDETWYNVYLENGWIYRRTSKVPLDWEGKIKEFIVTTDIDENGNVVTDKEGKEKRRFRAPADNDWALLKKKTESDLGKSGKTVGSYIYDTLLNNPDQKIKGGLIRTIERKYYRSELTEILNKQKEFHAELNDKMLYNKCVEELYRSNESHRISVSNYDFTRFIIEDVVFYQRPLKSKKSLIENCSFERRSFVDPTTKELAYSPIKCIAKSHPLFQEFRLWQFVANLRIIEREKTEGDKVKFDQDVTSEFFQTMDDYVLLFNWLNEYKEIDQKVFLKYPALGLKKNTDKYRWNYVEDKAYPCNQTRFLLKSRLQKTGNISTGFLDKDTEESLWHILYSVEDKYEIEKALTSFAVKKALNEEQTVAFVEQFKSFPPFKKEYGSYSAKAIKKLLQLMRMGSYWSENGIADSTKERIQKMIDGECDENIKTRTREKAILLREIKDFQGLPLWLASYIVYDRHSESGDVMKWETPEDIDYYLKHVFKQHGLRNPIVEVVVVETLKVVKDLWKTYGDFNEIHIELGREMKNPADKRLRMTMKNVENENTNLRIKALLAELANQHDVEGVRPYSPSQQEILRIYEEGVLNMLTKEDPDYDAINKISKMAQPSVSELIKYKCWLEQKYRSPYTGQMIPLARLFTSDYEIEHVIPQSRYFDDSFSNKVICEAAVNKDKDNLLAYEYIKQNEGKILEVGFGKKVKLFTADSYTDFIQSHYAGSVAKKKKLLMDTIPDSFIERQLNDSRYISREIKRLLSSVVREKDEEEAISKNVIVCTGSITDKLKRDWGLNDIWNTIVYPRFERLNQLTNSNQFGQWENKQGNRVFQTEMPLELQKGFNKKRIDHRHHAMDAIVIACATRNHVNYLNNESAHSKSKDKRYDLRRKLRRIETIEKQELKDGVVIIKKMEVAREFLKPWATFTQDAHEVLKSIVVSFKQNLRVVNKASNRYQCYVDGKKESVKQTKGDSWAIRKPMHKDTVSAAVSLRKIKKVRLSQAIEDWKNIVDKSLRKEVSLLYSQYGEKGGKHIVKYFKERDNKHNGLDIAKVDIYYFDNDCAASRVTLDDSFTSSKIESITDTGIQKILLKHLAAYNEIKGDKTIEHPELAFSADGLDSLNENITALNNGKGHKPIKKVRTYETMGNKFSVGQTGNKKHKYVEAAKGSNLFFAIYASEDGTRSYLTVPLNEVAERQKQGLIPVPEMNSKEDKLLFWLSPGDLVYVPSLDEEGRDVETIDLNPTNIYKMMSSSGNQCFFIPHFVSSPILQTKELGANNKAEKSWSGEMIKEKCIKIQTNRLGQIVKL